MCEHNLKIILQGNPRGWKSRASIDWWWVQLSEDGVDVVYGCIVPLTRILYLEKLTLFVLIDILHIVNGLNAEVTCNSVVWSSGWVKSWERLVSEVVTICDCLCSVSLVVRFLPVSPMWDAWQSEQLILYTADWLGEVFPTQWNSRA